MFEIKVMFSSRPKLVSEIIRNLIESQPDMKVVGEVVDPIKLIFALRKTPADVVIITPIKTNGIPSLCSQLLKEHTRLKILTLTVEGKAVYIYKSGEKRACIEKPTEAIILGIIRSDIL